MELLELYVEYGTDLKPIDSNIGNFNRFNHNIDRINIEIAESLDDYTLTMNAKRPDGSVNAIGYSLARVDSTNYQLICDDWLTEYEGLVEFSLVANKDGQVITFGKFYVDCIDTIRATSVASPDDPTFQEKVDKDLSTYDQVSEIVDNAFTFVDNDGSPEKMEIVTDGVTTELSLMTKGAINIKLGLKQDVIGLNGIGNDLLAQMPTMTLKGNSTGATADPDDLTVSEVMSMLTPSGQMEIPGSLLVNGDINQIGASYESHQQQVFTEKDFIITRDLATTGLGAGQYSGIIAKLADGTNNSALVFDGNGMARVGDIGTNLASPDFSQTQALATREDTPASRSIPYWDETSKCFKTLIANGGRPSFFISDTDESITMTNGNSTNSSVPTLTVKSRSSIQAPMQGWYQDYQINSFKKATVEYSGKFTSDVGFSGLTSSNNGLVDTNNNIIISRNLGDSVAALTVGQKHASSTGNILNLQFGGVNKLEVTKDGWLFQNGVRLLHTFSHPTGSTAIPIGRNVFLGQEAGNFTMGSTATSTDHASYNSAFGYQALRSNTTGSYNTANGVNALYSNTTGSYNTANGVNALYSNTTGTGNTANGMYALYSNTTGSYNTANGYAALRFNTTGSSNTANGYAAGRYFGSGTSALTIINNSIFIGTNSRANADNETNEIVIGYEALGKGSNTVTLGNSSITDYYFNANTNATSRFGNIRFGSITNGAVGDIPATINAITGTTAKLLSLQVNGVEKAYFNKDGRGFFESLSTGSNTLMGTLNGNDITSGVYNVLIGYLSGYKLTEGIDNVAIGKSALQDSLTTNDTIAIGTRALERLLIGDNTIGIGRNAGRYYGSSTDDLSSSTNSIYIGNEARAKENSVSNEIVLGYNAIGNGSNTATIGNSSLTKLYAGSYQVDTVIKASAVSVSSWSADATYAGYGYRATITMTGATSSDSAEVVYAHAEAISGNYSPICETLTDGVYIYSKVNTTITLAQVIVHKA